MINITLLKILFIFASEEREKSNSKKDNYRLNLYFTNYARTD